MSDQAKGLAALIAAYGRNGDNELVHMNKREVAALERLGRKHGIETTTNPHTGLKEAFNWQSTLGGVLGGIAGTFIAPGAGTAAGAALGSGLGTAASGGTTEQALTNGLISGATAWAGAGVADSLAQAGTDAATQGVTSGVTDATTQGITQLPGAGAFGDAGAAVVGAPTNLAGAGGLPTGAAPVTTAGQGFAPLGGDTASQAFNTPPPGTVPNIGALNTAGTNQANLALGNTPPVAEGMTPQAGTVVGDKFVQGSPTPVAEVPKMSTPGSSGQIPMGERASDYWGNVSKGIGSLDTAGKVGDFAMANRGPLIGTATGIAGIATAEPSGQSSDAGTTEETYGPLPAAEVYYTPTGERRTRIVDRPRYGNVNMAGGGEIFGDYDGVDMNRTGGTVVGGNTFANGGIARFGDGGLMGFGNQNRGGFAGFAESLQPGGAIGDWHGKLYGALGADQIMPGGAMGSLIPGANQFNAKKREEEERKRQEEEARAAEAKFAQYKQDWSDRYNAPVQMAAAGGMMGYAPGGGISSLGDYSDGGRMLRGPGDGVSDSIPASIEGRKPARLADGEFVVPARAVSELGNGSTEAGSKQLYAMLDRIAKKRKKGNGLAYQANPKKLMPA